MSSDWIGTEKQNRVLQRSEFEVLCGGARGGGKTELVFAWLTEPEYVHRKEYHFLVLRKNAEDLSDWLLRAKGFWGEAVQIVGKPAVLKFGGGGTGMTGHLKDEKAYEKYLGHEYQKITIEELTQIEKEDSYMKVISSCRINKTLRDRYGWFPQVLCTTNPGGRGHVWVKQRFVNVAYDKPYYDEIAQNWRIFVPFKIDDNPYADPSQKSFLDSLPNEMLRRAWRDGDWDIFAGQAFPGLSRERHSFGTDVPKTWPLYMSGDWGYNRPYSIQFWRIDPEGVAWLYHEEYGWGGRPNYGNAKFPDEVAAIVKEFLGGEKPEAFYVGPDWTDKSRGKAVVDAFTAVDLWPKIVSTPPGSRHQGFWEFQRRLQLNSIRVHEDRAKHWWRTVPNLSTNWEQDPEDIDTDQEDHSYDSTMLFLRSRPYLGPVVLPEQRRVMSDNCYPEDDWWEQKRESEVRSLM